MKTARFKSFSKGPELAQYAQEQIEWVELRMRADRRDLRHAQEWLRTASQLSHTNTLADNDQTRVG